MDLMGVYSSVDWQRVLSLLSNTGFDVLEADRFSGEIRVRVRA